MRRFLSFKGAALLGVILMCSVAIAQTVKKTAPHLFSGGITIGNTGAAIEDSYAVSATVDQADTLTATCSIGSAVTLTGAAVNDICVIGPNATAGALQGTWSCFVDATNSVKPVFCNPTVGSVNPASGTFTFRVFDP